MRRNQQSDHRRTMIRLKACLMAVCLLLGLTSCNMTDGVNSPWLPSDTPATNIPTAPCRPPLLFRRLMLKPGFGYAAKVALLLPLSGRGADTGQAMLNAAQLAMFDLQASTYFELLPIDTNGGAALPSSRQLIIKPVLFSGLCLPIMPRPLRQLQFSMA